MAHHKRRASSRRGRLPPATSSALAVAEAAIERAKKTADSKQPRFDQANPESVWNSVYRWAVRAETAAPPYMSFSPRRDQFLRNFWHLEPHLAGVLNGVIAIDKNRGWSITGGRNQVNRYTDVLHGAKAAPGMAGWRNFFSSQALSFYTTDMGTVCELGTDGQGGPLRALYHTDSAHCWLTGVDEAPLRYEPGMLGTSDGPLGIGGQGWKADEFFRVVSMPSDDENFRGLGFCAVSRCLELAKIMVAVYLHDQEVLRARMPDGLLLLQNISQDQWDTAMALREAQMNAKERQFFGGVYVLATAGIDQVDAKLVALSNLPAGFDLQTFTDQLMYGYALAFGYSPREFWPVSSGALGTATESQTQDDNSTGKGERDFILNYQEQLQEQLPPAILLEFDERDAKGDLDIAGIEQAKADIIETKASWAVNGQAVLTADQIMQLAAEQELIPAEWTAAEEDITATDTDDQSIAQLRERLREHPAVVRAIERFPSEPIVRYEYPKRRVVTLWESGAEAKRKRVWTGESMNSRHITRLADAIETAARAMQAAPAQLAAVPSTSPITIISSDAQMEALGRAMQTKPAIVNVTVDTTPLAEVFRGLTQQPTAEDLAQAMTRALSTAFQNLPHGPTLAEVAQVFTAIVAQLPRGPDAEMLIKAMARAMPAAAEPFDYQKFSTALTAAIKSMPATVINVPEQPAANITLELPTRETAHFQVGYDAQGQITDITKQSKAS